MMNFEVENPTLVKIIGASVAAVMFVGAALLMSKSVEAGEGLMMLAGTVLGAVGVQVKGKTP